MSKQHTTWNYVLTFKGWAMCRMATDPDPSNEPRGVSGYSFALPGEEDFDQIVYLQPNEKARPRSHCPPISVRVTGGSQYKAEVAGDQERFDGDPEPIDSDSPLYGATVDLLHRPVFDSRNSTIVYNGYGLLSPFDLLIKSKTSDVSFARSYHVDPDAPDRKLESIPIDQLEPHIMNTAVYNAADPAAATPGSADILLESGILDPVAYRRRRLENLLADLPGETPEQHAALQKRIAELRIDDPQNRRTAQLGAKVLVPYILNSKHAQVNGATVHDAGNPWSLEMWMGGWDTDALSFFIMGTVKVVVDFDPMSHLA